MEIHPIPKDCKIVKIKDISIINPKRPSMNNTNIFVTFISMSDISAEGKIINKKRRKYMEVSNGYTSFKNGDILVAKITPCFENGKGILLSDLENNIGFGSTEFHVIRAKCNKTFLYYHTISFPFRNKGRFNMTGSAGQKRVPAAFIKNYTILLLPNSEQKKVAEILSTWDRAIGQVADLIKLKERRKRVLIQQLLTGRQRFPKFDNNWEPTKLGEFLIPTIRPVPKPSEPYLALAIRSHGKGTFFKKIEKPDTVMMDTLFMVKENDLILNITFAWEGAIAIVRRKDESALVSHRFPTYVFNQNIMLPEYFKYIIITKKMVFELGLVSPGGAGRNRVLNKRDFLKIKVLIPDIKEQKKIAQLLENCSQEIELLKRELELLKNQKQGLMQKLLTGQIRVKV